MDELRKIRDKLNELKNIHKEIKCLKEFIRFKRLDDEYYNFRIEFFKQKQKEERCKCDSDKCDKCN